MVVAPEDQVDPDALGGQPLVVRHPPRAPGQWPGGGGQRIPERKIFKIK